MMMALSDFVFEVGTLPFQQVQRSQDWRHGQSERFDARPASQFVGPGQDKITLTGALYPGFAGSFSSLDKIRALADTGNAFPLVAEEGKVMGNWFIRSLSETRTEFLINGVARKADFSIELERTDG